MINGPDSISRSDVIPLEPCCTNKEVCDGTLKWISLNLKHDVVCLIHSMSDMVVFGSFEISPRGGKISISTADTRGGGGAPYEGAGTVKHLNLRMFAYLVMVTFPRDKMPKIASQFSLISESYSNPK